MISGGDRIRQDLGFQERLGQALRGAPRRCNFTPYAEKQIDDSFPDSEDNRRMMVFHRLPWPEWPTQAEGF